MDYEVGDIVKLKKQHPCGSKEWRILRVGADFRLECMGCSHQIMIPRKQVEKNTIIFFCLFLEKLYVYIQQRYAILKGI